MKKSKPTTAPEFDTYELPIQRRYLEARVDTIPYLMGRDIRGPLRTLIYAIAHAQIQEGAYHPCDTKEMPAPLNVAYRLYNTITEARELFPSVLCSRFEDRLPGFKATSKPLTEWDRESPLDLYILRMVVTPRQVPGFLYLGVSEFRMNDMPLTHLTSLRTKHSTTPGCVCFFWSPAMAHTDVYDATRAKDAALPTRRDELQEPYYTKHCYDIFAETLRHVRRHARRDSDETGLTYLFHKELEEQDR